MKRLAALFFTLALLLIPASAHTEEQLHTFPIQFHALAEGADQTVSLLSLPQTGTFDPENPTYGAQLKDDALALAAYQLLESQLNCDTTQLELNMAAYSFHVSDWSSEVERSLNAAVAAFVYDHPESQYCTLNEYGYASSGNMITKVYYYVRHQKDGAAWKDALDEYVARFAADFDRTLPVTEQYRRIHDLVCRTAEYDEKAAVAGVPSTAHTVYGALVLDNMAVCEGYAKAFKVLCDAVDLPCMLIVGEAQQNGIFYGFSNHMWNAVCVDGSWYAVDTTWDDETTNYRMGTLNVTPIVYDYFLSNDPFQEGSALQDHRSTGNIYFANRFPMVFDLPTLADGSHPVTATLAPAEGTITFYDDGFAFPYGFWDVTFSDGFTPGSLTTIRLLGDSSMSVSAPLSLPADRVFLCADTDFRRSAGYTGAILSISGRLDVTAPLDDPNFFSLSDSAVVNLTAGLSADEFVMNGGTVNIFGEVQGCVTYHSGNLTVNGTRVTDNLHSYIPGTGTCRCGKSESCPHSFAELPDAAFLYTEATCTSPALYFKSCSICGAAGTETFAHGEAAPHAYVETVKDSYLSAAATCTSPALYFKSCQSCGAVGAETFAHGEAAPHTVSPVLQSAATCTSPAVYRDLCLVCGFQGEPYTQGSTLPHDLLSVALTAAICTSPATFHDVCSVCGYQSNPYSEGDPAPHDFTQLAQEKYLSSAATCTSPALYFKSCSVCGLADSETFSHGDPVPHIYAEKAEEAYCSAAATCTSPALYFKSCQSCGAVGAETFAHGEAAPHTASPVLQSAATCTSPALYRDLCSVCGHQTDPYTLGEPVPHGDDNQDLLCDSCGADLSDGAEGILALTGNSVTIRVQAETTQVILCVAAYEGARMTGLSFQTITVVPGQLLTLEHTVSGTTLRAFVLNMDSYTPAFPTK